MIRKVLLLIVVIFITKTTQERPNICTGHPTGTLVFNAKNCSEFYNCFHGIPIPDACPSGQLFNDIINKCDNAERVECFNCPVNDFNDIPVPNECSQFVRCSKYSDPEQITCSVGLYFDPTVNMCNVANKVECKFKARCPKNNEFLVITPDRDTCNKLVTFLNDIIILCFKFSR